jgi:hypothetical protein
MPKKPQKKVKHVVKYVSPGGHTDKFECSCGWESNGYWDLVEAAWDEWLVHAYKTKTEIRPVDHARQERVVREHTEHEKRRKELRKRLGQS